MNMGVIIERVDDSQKDEDYHLATVLHQAHSHKRHHLGPA